MLPFDDHPLRDRKHTVLVDADTERWLKRRARQLGRRKGSISGAIYAVILQAKLADYAREAAAQPGGDRRTGDRRSAA